MARFLRDEHLQNLTLTADRLRQLNKVFQTRFISKPNDLQGGLTENMHFSYVIRFDNKGYRVFNIEDVISYFNQADYVERVIFAIESDVSLKINRAVGSFMELRLDHRDENACFLQINSDDSDWVDASFSSVKEVLTKCTNKNWFARNTWAQLVVQLFGLFIGFLLSLWAAVRISPYISVENAFFISFLFVLLVFSNFWTFLNQRLLNLINVVFPNLRFYRPDRDRLHWLMQALIGGVVVAISLFLLNLMFGYVGRLLEELFINTT